jgi:hypothetical protein
MTFLEHVNTRKYKIYLDMDGVLTDFSSRFNDLGKEKIENLRDKNEELIWRIINSEGEKFWSQMKWMHDGKELWNYVKDMDVRICSTPARSQNSKTGKKIWCKRELGVVEVILTAKKEEYACKNCILIDDRKDNIDAWNKAGGIGIVHKNTKDTISKLKKIIEENVGIKHT